jgi:predicted kinase
MDAASSALDILFVKAQFILRVHAEQMVWSEWQLFCYLSAGRHRLVFTCIGACRKGLILLSLNSVARGVWLREPFAQFVKAELKPATLLVTCGLPGTWKTETSEEISKIKGYPILRSDLIRLEVLKGQDVFDEKIASNMNKRLSVYDELFRRADELVQKGGGGVILDATFVTQELRRRAAEIAAKNGLAFVVLQTSCSEEASLARILRRTKEKYESNALTKEAYLSNKKKFEPVDIDDLKKRNPQLKITHLTVDTEHDAPESWFIVGMEKR